MKNKNGFTMSEVLITLGVIGVVAAMTLPSVIKNYQNKILESQFRRNYSDISQLSNIFLNEFGNCNVENFNEMNKLLKTKFKNANYINRRFTYIWKNYTKTGNPGQMTENCLSGSNNNYILSNQALIGFCKFNMWGDYISITIDLNGYSKKPNALGHDLFFFTFDNKTCKIQAPAYGHVCLKTNSGDVYAGVNCATYAMQNKCPDDSSKKYFECLP